jgi:hypothetical protein
MTDKIDKPDAEWRQSLSGEAYQVLRHEGTERPGSSPLNDEKRGGTWVKTSGPWQGRLGKNGLVVAQRAFRFVAPMKRNGNKIGLAGACFDALTQSCCPWVSDPRGRRSSPCCLGKGRIKREHMRFDAGLFKNHWSFGLGPVVTCSRPTDVSRKQSFLGVSNSLGAIIHGMIVGHGNASDTPVCQERGERRMHAMGKGKFGEGSGCGRSERPFQIGNEGIGGMDHRNQKLRKFCC